MNESHIRTSVLIIIVVAAVGIGVYLGIGSGTEERGQAQILEKGSGTDFTGAKTEPDPKLSQTPSELKPELPPAEQSPEVTIESAPEQAPKLTPSTVIPIERRNPEESASNGIPRIESGAGSSADDDELKNSLGKATDSEDYSALGTLLAEAYKRYPQGKKEFVEIESRAYVKATSYLDQEKNVEKAKAAADAVYNKHPFGWRFKYLRVRVFERLGRDAFAAGDLAGAEKHALTMLGMEFRPEGANLMGDIYLKRIDEALAKGDKATAQAAYEEIKDYEVSPDRRKALDERFGKIRGL